MILRQSSEFGWVLNCINRSNHAERYCVSSFLKEYILSVRDEEYTFSSLSLMVIRAFHGTAK
jgi:hypothetical protein